MLAQYNQESEEYKEFENEGIESFISKDNDYLIRVIEGELTNEYIKQIKEEISS